MSWSDPARRFESSEDVALRAELSDLLGLEPRLASPVGPTPELIRLAEELRKEALRRRRTERRRPSWGLMAAAVLPLVAGMGALGWWGREQQAKARALSEQAQRVQELERISEAHRLALVREREAKEQIREAFLRVAAKRGRKIPELVIPVDPLVVPQAGQERVKAGQ